MQTLDKAWAVAFALVRAALKKMTGALLLLRLDCHKKWLFVIYRGNTKLSLMWRLFYWGGSTSVSTASRLEITLKSKIRYGLLVMSAFPASVPDDTEVVPPKSQKQIHRPSMPLPLIDDEPQKSPVR